MLSKRKRVYATKTPQRKKYKPSIPRYIPFNNEVKYIDTEYFGLIPTTLANVNTDFGPINLIQQGDGESQRIGRKVQITSIHVKGYIENSFDQAGAGSIRTAIVLDKVNDGQTSNALDVYQQTADPGLESCAFRNLDRTDRFRVLKDEMHTFSHHNSYWAVSTAQFQCALERLPININIDKLNITTMYTLDTPSINAIVSNLISFWCWTDSVSANDLSCRVNIRVRYVG